MNGRLVAFNTRPSYYNETKIRYRNLKGTSPDEWWCIVEIQSIQLKTGTVSPTVEDLIQNQCAYDDDDYKLYWMNNKSTTNHDKYCNGPITCMSNAGPEATAPLCDSNNTHLHFPTCAHIYSFQFGVLLIISSLLIRRHNIIGQCAIIINVAGGRCVQIIYQLITQMFGKWLDGWVSSGSEANSVIESKGVTE